MNFLITPLSRSQFNYEFEEHWLYEIRVDSTEFKVISLNLLKFT